MQMLMLPLWWLHLSHIKCISSSCVPPLEDDLKLFLVLHEKEKKTYYVAACA